MQSFPLESTELIESEKKLKPQIRLAMERAFSAAGIHDPAQKQWLRKLFKEGLRRSSEHGYWHRSAKQYVKAFHDEIGSPLKSKLFSVRFGQVGRKFLRAQKRIGEDGET